MHYQPYKKAPDIDDRSLSDKNKIRQSFKGQFKVFHAKYEIEIDLQGTK